MKMSFFVNPEEMDKTDYYLIGVDTASGSSGLAAYNAIEVYSYRDFVQVAEANFKLGHLLKYGEIIDAIFRYFRSLVGDRIILCIENNSIGKAPIEVKESVLKPNSSTSSVGALTSCGVSLE